MSVRWRKELLYIASVGFVCAHFSLFYATRNNYYVNLDQYIAGTATLPFQSRALTAWIGAALLPLVSHFDLVISSLPKPFNSAPHTIFTALNFASLFIATIATGTSVQSFTGNADFARAASFVLPLMGLYNYLLMVGNWALAYPYDLPQLALFTVCLLAIFKKNHAAFYLLFTLAALNRETALFIIAIYALYHLGPPLGTALKAKSTPVAARLTIVFDGFSGEKIRVLGHVLLQIAILVICRALVFRVYKDNPIDAPHYVAGAFTLHYVARNGLHIINPVYWPAFLSNFAFLWVPLLLGLRHLHDPGLRAALFVTFPWIATMALVGILVEMRVFGELISLFSVALSVIAFNFLRATRRFRG